MKNKVVAIVGATGAVGREFVGCIEQRGVPIKALKLLASARSAGQKQSFRGEELTIEEFIETFVDGREQRDALFVTKRFMMYQESLTKALTEEAEGPPPDEY